MTTTLIEIERLNGSLNDLVGPGAGLYFVKSWRHCVVVKKITTDATTTVVVKDGDHSPIIQEERIISLIQEERLYV